MVVSNELDWGETDHASVEAELPNVSEAFRMTALGKDVLDAVYTKLLHEGIGDVRGWSRDYFHQQVRRALAAEDLASWEVGRRLRAWEATSGHLLLAA
jgi:hypothetical protein